MAWKKRLTTPSWWGIEKKVKKYAVAARGPHALKGSIPLAVIVRDKLKLAKTLKEAKNIISSGKVLVDGRVKRDYKFGVGFMDSLHIPEFKKAYRLVSGGSGLKLIEIPEEEAKKKLCKIVNKTVLKKGKLQINLHDGSNIITDKNDYKTNTSLLLKVPEMSVVDTFKMEAKMLALVTKGRNQGKIAKLKKVEILRSTQPNRVWLEVGEKEFEAPYDAVIIVGKDKPAIKIGE